jgi:S-formylglutathione hydrolase FrmB
MALLEVRFFSEKLGMWTTMTVLMPQDRREGERFKTLYLLHGLSDDDSGWTRRTSIERYVEPLRLAVVMPQVHRSFYTDMKHGLPYWTFISEEVPKVARAMFGLSDRREDNFVAGLSMGGYGAFKLALRCPDRFGAAASLSGALNMAAPRHLVEEVPPEIVRDMRLIFGETGKAGEEDDLLWLLEQRAREGATLPKLYQVCGTEDFLYKDNQVFLDACRRLGVPVTYKEGPGGHDWGFWDHWIQDVLAWLPL